MKRFVSHSLAKIAALSFVGAMSAAASAQIAPPNECRESAVAVCNNGQWQEYGYPSEQQCIESNMSGCAEPGGGGDGTPGYCYIMGNRIVCH